MVVVGEWHAADQSLLCTLRCGAVVVVVVAVMSILSGMTVPAVTSTLGGQLGAFPGNGVLHRSQLFEEFFAPVGLRLLAGRGCCRGRWWTAWGHLGWRRFWWGSLSFAFPDQLGAASVRLTTVILLGQYWLLQTFQCRSLQGELDLLLLPRQLDGIHGLTLCLAIGDSSLGHAPLVTHRCSPPTLHTGG